MLHPTTTTARQFLAISSGSCGVAISVVHTPIAPYPLGTEHSLDWRTARRRAAVPVRGAGYVLNRSTVLAARLHGPRWRLPLARAQQSCHHPTGGPPTSR